MLNIEAVLCDYLAKKTGIPTYVEVPENMPDRFITVERTGGGDNRTSISENPTVVIDYWGQTRADAHDICAAGDKAVIAMRGVVKGISNVRPLTACVHYPDALSGRERYESTYSFTTFEY